MTEPASTKVAADETHVLIIGAGVTGLLIAHGLKKAGISFSIFEAEASASVYRPREWSMGIHWAIPMLKSLLPEDLSARLNEAQNDPSLKPQPQDVLPMYDGRNGEILKELPVPGMIRVSRRKMRAFCSQGIDVQYGCELVSISDGPQRTIQATFRNGKIATGTIILGADGAKSKVRELLLGPEKAAVTPMEIVHANVAVKYNDAEIARLVRSAHPSCCSAVHPKGFMFLAMQDVPDPDKPETWTFQVVNGWIGQRDPEMDNAARLAQIKAYASDLAEPFRSATLAMPADTIVTYDTMAYWVCIPWDNKGGRTTLAGDAAHPMPPYRGQGLNHAINDCVNFVAALQKAQKGEASLEEAISAYDDEVVKRGADEVVSSKQNSLMVLNWDQFMDSPLMKSGLSRNIVSPTKS